MIRVVLRTSETDDGIMNPTTTTLLSSNEENFTTVALIDEESRRRAREMLFRVVSRYPDFNDDDDGHGNGRFFVNWHRLEDFDRFALYHMVVLEFQRNLERGVAELNSYSNPINGTTRGKQRPRFYEV